MAPKHLLTVQMWRLRGQSLAPTSFLFAIAVTDMHASNKKDQASLRIFHYTKIVNFLEPKP
jgi:hypothetical protein